MQAEFAPSFFEDEVTKIDLWVYWRLVRKHLRLIGAVVAGTVFVTLIHLLMTTPIYTAKTTVMILPKAPSGIDPAEALLEIEASYDGSDYFKTQNEILKSRTLAASVVRNLGLNRNPAFTGSGGRPGLFGAVIGGLRQRLHDLLTPPPPGSSAPRSGLLGVSADQIDAYLGGLSIKRFPPPAWSRSNTALPTRCSPRASPTPTPKPTSIAASRCTARPAATPRSSSDANWWSSRSSSKSPRSR